MNAKIPLCFCCAAAFLVGNPASAQVATFRGLGYLNEGDFSDSRAYGISADGLHIVGYSSTSSGSKACMWPSFGSAVALGAIPPQYLGSVAQDVSGDGSVVVGQGFLGGYDADAFIWTAQSGYLWMGPTDQGDLPLASRGVSDDGSAVAGNARHGTGIHERAFVWSEDSGAISIGPSEPTPIFWGLSGDGRVAVGQFNSPIGWREDTGIFHLTNSAAGGAFCASYDGTVIGGWYARADGNLESFRWTAETGIVGLGDLAGDPFSSAIYGMSANGDILAGYGFGLLGKTAVMWNRYHGLRSIENTFRTVFGLPLTNWHLYEAKAVSADGRTIVGYGRNPSGQYEAWVATIPLPCPADLTRNYLVDLDDLTQLLSNFGLASGAVFSNGDIDLDGDVDFYDLTEMLSEFGTICQ